MFSDILRIKPVLDESSAKQMESSLSARFTRVASRFGSGLKNVIKGSVLGISVALLSKILAPIETLETKLKALLGQGTDISELAEKLGTSPGQLKQLQDVAASLNISPDKFNEVLSKFAESMERARDENSRPLEARSASTVILGDIASQKDSVEAFKRFITLLRTTGAGQGIDQPLSARAIKLVNDAASSGTTLSEEQRQSLIRSGDLRRRTGAEAQAEFEKQVLGAQQFGGVRRLIGADLESATKAINEPSVEALNRQITKLADLDAQKALLTTQAETKDFMQASKAANATMIAAMVSANARSEKETTERLASYDNLKKGADAVADISKGFTDLLDGVSTGLGYLKDITAFIPQIKSSPVFKGILKTFGKGE